LIYSIIDELANGTVCSVKSKQFLFLWGFESGPLGQQSRMLIQYTITHHAYVTSTDKELNKGNITPACAELSKVVFVNRLNGFGAIINWNRNFD